MKEKYNSHVVLSQTLLNGFSHKSREGKKIWVMGIKTGNITEKKVKEFNVVKKYFNEESEKYLSDEIETSIGEIRKVLIDFKKGSIDNMRLDKQKLFRIFDFQFLRNPLVLSNYNKTSKVTPILGQMSPDMLLNIIKDTNFKFFSADKYEINILINKTTIGLITNSSGFYEAKARGEKLIVMPLNSAIAIVLYNKNFTDEEGYVRFDKIDEISKLNHFAYIFENEKTGKVIGKQQDLVILKEYIKTTV